MSTLVNKVCNEASTEIEREAALEAIGKLCSIKVVNSTC